MCLCVLLVSFCVVYCGLEIWSVGWLLILFNSVVAALAILFLFVFASCVFCCCLIVVVVYCCYCLC